MKLSNLANALAIFTVASAETIYVTQTHYFTVYGSEAGTAVGYSTSEEQVQASTLVQQVDLGDNDAVATSSNIVQAQTGTSEIQSTSAPLTQSESEETSTSAAATTAPAGTSTEASSTTESSDSSIYAEIGDSSGIDGSFATSILDAHNQKRAIHSASDLSWSKKLYDYAQAYADKYDCSGSLTHSGGSYGENLAVGYSSGVAALDAWYDEGNDYDYSSYPLDHFTQVIWKSTTQLGCAYKDCSSKNWGKYVICSYNPAGNVVGEASENVSQ